MDKGVILRFYKRKDIQDEIVEHAKNKEIGLRYGDGFGKRPDVINYPREVLELAQQGATSFHASEEIWSNPLAISAEMKRKDLDELRIGWDLVLDIDCVVMEYSRICADLVVKFLTFCQVKDISCKFSGNKGFHIGVPFEAFPRKVGEKDIKDMFPEAPKKIAHYVSHHIEEELSKRILEFEQGQISRIQEKVDLPNEDLVKYEKTPDGGKIPKLHIDKFLEIDTVLISSRHLYRMPYSLHEKSGLVSLPIDPAKVLEFEKPMANPDLILTPMFTFLSRDVQGESARNLLMQALDFDAKMATEEKPIKKFADIQLSSPIDQKFFPPCIQKLCAPMEDGKKRAIFVLMNYLGKVGWKKDEIKAFLYSWNKKHPEPLREVYLRGQLNHFQPGEKLPPNCDNDGYYKALQVHCNQGWCQRLKNPVNYTMSRWRRWINSDEYKKEQKAKEKSANQPPREKPPQEDRLNNSQSPSHPPESRADLSLDNTNL